ncbi:hypothetical protein ACFWE3_22740 [Mycobacteriaceae bacterium NPDC060252]
MLRARDVLRQSGVLPAETTPGEYAFAVFDAAANDWFDGPDGALRLMEGLAHAWVETSVPSLHLRQEAWRQAFEQACSAAPDLDMALPSNLRQIEVFRGCPEDRVEALSWTVDRNTAVWFAHRALRTGAVHNVYRAVAPREAVLVDLRRFNLAEYEVLVRPELLRDVAEVEIGDVDQALSAWFRRAQRTAREARAQGFRCEDPEPPDLDVRVERHDPPVQSTDPDGPRYIAPPWSPANVIWPKPSESKITQLGDQLSADFPFRWREDL